MAQLKKILISLPDTLLDEINDFVKVHSGVSRSEMIRVAMKEYMESRRKMEIRERLIKGYELMSKINIDWAESCLEADNKTQNFYEEILSESE